ncbi:MAG TPA: SDR family oxidoreductase [Gemmatimonadaceae bacterium]|nr:SDR family oxidoreductase [Gemmatimonadaceae bacterium]
MRSKQNGSPRATALVTGGSGGIGLEIAKVLARKGFDLVLVARKRDTLEAAAGQLEGKFDIKAHVFAADLRRPDAPEQIFDFLHNDNLPIEVLVNNAGFGVGGEFSETELQRELEMIQVNIAALTHLTKLFLPPMMKRRSGRVLNVASTAAFQPGPLMAVYYATKSYVLSFSQALAEELRNTGITVTALCPGPTQTDFAEAAQMTNSRLFTTFGVADADDVAQYGVHAMLKGKRVAIPGIRNKMMAQANRLAPRSLSTRLARMAQETRANSD